MPFTAAITSALAPTRRSAIENAELAVDQLIGALRVIDGANREIERAGGTASVRFPPIYRNAVAALRDRLRRLCDG